MTATAVMTKDATAIFDQAVAELDSAAAWLVFEVERWGEHLPLDAPVRAALNDAAHAVCDAWNDLPQPRLDRRQHAAMDRAESVLDRRWLTCRPVVSTLTEDEIDAICDELEALVADDRQETDVKREPPRDAAKFRRKKKPAAADLRDRDLAADYLDREFFAPIDCRLEAALRFGGRGTSWMIDVRDLRTGVLHENIELGRSGDLTQTKVRNQIQEPVGRLLRRVSPEEWDLFRDALWTLSEEEEGADPLEEARGWLSEMRTDEARGGQRFEPDVIDVNDKPALARVLEEKLSFVGSDWRWYVRPADLLAYVTQGLGYRATDNADLRRRLRRLGFVGGREKGQVSARGSDGEVRKCRYVISEPGFDPDE